MIASSGFANFKRDTGSADRPIGRSTLRPVDAKPSSSAPPATGKCLLPGLRDRFVAGVARLLQDQAADAAVRFERGALALHKAAEIGERGRRRIDRGRRVSTHPRQRPIVVGD